MGTRWSSVGTSEPDGPRSVSLRKLVSTIPLFTLFRSLMRKREGVDYIPVEAAKLSRVSHRKAEYVSEVNDTVIVLGN